MHQNVDLESWKFSLFFVAKWKFVKNERLSSHVFLEKKLLRLRLMNDAWTMKTKWKIARNSCDWGMFDDGNSQTVYAFRVVGNERKKDFSRFQRNDANRISLFAGCMSRNKVARLIIQWKSCWEVVDCNWLIFPNGLSGFRKSFMEWNRFEDHWLNQNT